jgi:hypothetical protein
MIGLGESVRELSVNVRRSEAKRAKRRLLNVRHAGRAAKRSRPVGR